MLHSAQSWQTEESRVLMLKGSSFQVGGGCFASSDGMGLVFSCGHWDRTFQVVDVETGTPLQSISYHHGTVTCLAHSSSSGGGTSGGTGGTVQVGGTTVAGVLVTGSEDCTVAGKLF